MLKQVAVVLVVSLLISCQSAPQITIQGSEVDRILGEAGRDLAKRTPRSLRASAAAYQRAVELDDKSARGWAGLAESSALMGLYSVAIPSEVMPRAAAAAARALELDPGNALTHAVLGLVQYLHQWEWKSAESSFTRALELEPELVEAHHWLAMMLSATGRNQESADRIQQAVQLRPESALLAVKLGTILANAGLLKEARTALKTASVRFPRSVLGWNELGLLALREGKNEEAIQHFSRASDLEATSERALAGLAVARSRLGESDAPPEILQQLQSLQTSGFISPVILAEVHLAGGSLSRALDELERGYQLHDPALVYILTRPGLSPLWEESRFRQLVLRIGLRSPDWDAGKERSPESKPGGAAAQPLREGY